MEVETVTLATLRNFPNDKVDLLKLTDDLYELRRWYKEPGRCEVKETTIQLIKSEVADLTVALVDKLTTVQDPKFSDKLKTVIES